MYFVVQALGLTPPASPLQEGSIIVADCDHEPKNELDLCDGGKDAYVVEVRVLLHETDSRLPIGPIELI